MSAEEKEYVTRDKPAEKGITINNILLAIVILLGGWFGESIKGDIGEMKQSVNLMQSTLLTMQVFDGTSREKFKQIESHMDDCREWHNKHEARFYEIEKLLRIN